MASPRQRPLVTLLDHLRTRLCVDLSGFQLGVPQKLLNLLDGHAPLKQRSGHRVAQKMRVDPLGDLRVCRRLLDDLLDAPGRVLRVLHGFEQIPGGAIAEVCSQLLGKL